MTIDHPSRVEPIWQLGGSIRRLAWHGRYVVLAVGTRLLVLDANDPSEPVLVGESASVLGTLEQIAVDGALAYAATRERLHVFALGEPAEPCVVGTYPLAPVPDRPVSTVRQIHLADGTLYVACEVNGAGQIVAVDASDPRQLRPIGDPFPGVRIAADGRYAYVANPTGVDVLDVADPAAPTAVSSLTLADSPGHVHVFDRVGDHLWYSSGKPYSNGPIHAIDISDPRNPRQSGTFPRSTSHNPPVVSRDRAYRATGSDRRTGLSILDLADPVAPRAIGGYHVRVGVGEVAAQGPDVALSDDRGNRLLLLDTQNPRRPDLVGGFQVSGWASSVAVAGTYAYVGMDDGLHVISLADPASPAEVNRYKMSAVRGVAVRGGYAWVHSADEIRILDLADPARPVGVDAFRTHGGTDQAHRVVLGDEYACIVTGYDNPYPRALHVRRLDDPAFPTKVGDYPETLGIKALAVEGRRAIVIDEKNIAELIDLESLHRIAPLGELPRGYGPAGAVLSRGHAFIWAELELHVLDLADPEHPFKLAVVQLEAAEQAATQIQDVAVAGDRLYLATREDLRVFDVAAPRHPVEIERRPQLQVGSGRWPRSHVVVNQLIDGPAALSIRGGVCDAVLVGDHLFLACEDEGFWTMRVQPVVAPTNP